MPITLKPDVLKVDAVKMYPLGPADREFVNKEFNKLHEQERMQYTTQSTQFGQSIFVIWRTIERPKKLSKRKRRVIVDIRDLNKIILIDAYFLSLQSNIIALVSDCQYIIVVDAARFFH